MKIRLARKIIESTMLPNGEPSGRMYRQATYNRACFRLRMWREDGPGVIVREDLLDVSLRVRDEMMAKARRRASCSPA